MIKPTTEVYSELQEIFDFFNQKLFEGKLPQCLILLQRSRGAAGYFLYSSWENKDGKRVDEIALNPSCFSDRGLKVVLSTLVHEMTHLWQSYFGNSGKHGWHNKQWAMEMERLGLIPSHTGEKGGNKTGYKMTHYILTNGLYDSTFSELQALGGNLSWIEAIGGDKKVYSKKIKYTCPKCAMKLWGKSNLSVVCGGCKKSLVSKQ